MRTVLVVASILAVIAAAPTLRGSEPNAANAEALRRALENPSNDNLALLLKAAQEASNCFPKPSEFSRAVRGLGEDAVPEIVAQVKIRRGSTWTGQVDNLYMLAQIGPDAKRALPVLEEIIESPNTHRYVRHYALTAQAAIQQDITKLTRLVESNPDFGAVALHTVQNLGAKANAVGPAILRLARTKTSNRRRYLAALEKIAPKLATQLKSELGK